MTNSRANKNRMLSTGAKQAIVIASGAITINRSTSFIEIDTESAASTDTISQIDGASLGDIIIVSSKDAARDPTIVDTSQIILEGSVDMLLSDPSDKWIAHWDGTNWIEISRSTNL